MGWEKDFKKFVFYEFMEKSSKRRRRRRKKSDPVTEIAKGCLSGIFLFVFYILFSRNKSSDVSDPVDRVNDDENDID